MSSFQSRMWDVKKKKGSIIDFSVYVTFSFWKECGITTMRKAKLPNP